MAPTLWDVTFRTAVAQAELEDRERPGAYHQLAFHRSDGEQLLIDTTRPELLAACVAVVAHPDDMEYGAAAAVARWTQQGKHIAYVLVSDGEAGISTMPPSEVGPLRRDEQLASCRVVGVDDVEFLGWPDGSIVEGLALRAAIPYQPMRARTRLAAVRNLLTGERQGRDITARHRRARKRAWKRPMAGPSPG